MDGLVSYYTLWVFSLDMPALCLVSYALMRNRDMASSDFHGFAFWALQLFLQMATVSIAPAFCSYKFRSSHLWILLCIVDLWAGLLPYAINSKLKLKYERVPSRLPLAVASELGSHSDRSSCGIVISMTRGKADFPLLLRRRTIRSRSWRSLQTKIETWSDSRKMRRASRLGAPLSPLLETR